MAVKKTSESQKDPISAAFTNLVSKFDETELKKIGNDVVDGYDTDEESRAEWLKRYQTWVRLCNVRPEQDYKSFPWEGAANIVIPMISIACVQFQSRAEDALFSGGTDIVKGFPKGLESSDAERADRIARYMNHQLNYKMENFFEGFSSSLMQEPLGGTMVRKTYYDHAQRQCVSDSVRPEDFVVNYWTKYLETSPRITQVHYLDQDYIDERIEEGVYRNVDLAKVSFVDEGEVRESGNANIGIAQPENDNEISVRKILEQHKYLKIDDKRIPVVVFVDYETREVLRIVSRINPTNKKIMHYFTKYGFIPNPDGGFYDIGFGMLLERMNETANSLMNMLLDSGHLSNMQGGFVLKRSGLGRGQMSFTKGEFKEVDAKGIDDIRKMIMPMAFKEPSQVLFQLLGMVQDYANRVTTVSESMTGDMPRSGVGSMGVVNLIEQGLKVFASIFKRIHRSFGKELKKIYDLNGLYLDENEYFTIVVNQDMVDIKADKPMLKELGIGKKDFQAELDVVPVSDPNIISKSEKNAKAQSVYQTIMSNPLFAQNPVSNYYATEDYIATFDTNEARRERILGPIRQQIEIQIQQQALQQQKLQQQAQQQEIVQQEIQMKQQVLGMYQQRIQQGQLPPELVNAAIQDQIAMQNQGLGLPQQ